MSDSRRFYVHLTPFTTFLILSGVLERIGPNLTKIPKNLYHRNSDQVFLPLPWVAKRDEAIPSRRYILFEEAGHLIELGMIAGSVIDPENQQEVPPGLTRVTLIGVDGREYDVVARYDGATQQIS